MAERRGMGRGLSAILPEASAGAEMRELPIESIQPNADQPRKRFEDRGIDALAESIAASGVVQPLLVTSLSGDRYEIIAGERRWRAARLAGLDRVPVVIRDSDEAERLEVALIENMVREDLNPVEEARACAALVEDLGLSKEDLGKRVGRSRPRISNLIRLLELPDEVLGMLEEGRLSEGHGRALLQVPDHGQRRKMARQAAKAGWSVRETERRARRAGEGGAKRRARSGPSSEERAAIDAAAERLESGLGEEVRVRPAGEGLAVEIRLDGIEQLEGLADKLARRR